MEHGVRDSQIVN